MDRTVERFDQFFMFTKHLLSGDINERGAGLFGTCFGQHGNTGPQRPPHHHSGRDAETMLFDLLRFFQRQTDHLLESLFHIGITADIVPIENRIPNFVENVCKLFVHDISLLRYNRYQQDTD